MIQIHLDQLQFYAYHGLYQEERILGNDYLVDITLDHQPENFMIQSIDETVDYSKIYQMIAQRMKIPTELLETIATEFCVEVMKKYLSVQAIQISIKKLHPPIPQFIGNVGVSVHIKRSEL
jgi:7,8-dihydroneopterin aldolase/epimerase/oxygenase